MRKNLANAWQDGWRPYQWARLCLCLILTLALPSQAIVHRTVGPHGQFPDVDAAISALLPFTDDVVLSVDMGFNGYTFPTEVDSESGFNGFSLEILGNFQFQSEATYYVDGDVEFRVGEDNSLETIESTDGEAFLVRAVYQGRAPSTGDEYFVKNNLGSTVTVTNEDGTAIGPYYEYHAYGAQDKVVSTGVSRITPTYSGKELDEFGLALNGDGQGLYHYGARYYDADIGLWLGVDPEFETHNPYAFAAGNPLVFTDADGRSVYTKAAKVIYKVIKTGDAAEAFADNIKDAQILFGGGSSLGARGLALVSLASEFSPVSVGDLKDGFKIAKKVAEKVEKHQDEVSKIASAAKSTGGGRSGKQARLRELAGDPKVSSADRGWLQNEIRHVETGNRKSIRLPGNSRNSKTPGKELAHKRGERAKDGHSYKNAVLQDADLHKLEHKHEGYK